MNNHIISSVIINQIYPSLAGFAFQFSRVRGLRWKGERSWEEKEKATLFKADPGQGSGR
jgi:hypothetical protein